MIKRFGFDSAEYTEASKPKLHQCGLANFKQMK
jgi:hypothetical protein